MSEVAIMTDSVACIPRHLAEECKLKIVPAANIYVNGHTYIDGVTISALEAYKLIEKDPDKFATSAITPEYLVNAYKEVCTYFPKVLFITVASALSAVYKTATLAADMFVQQSPGVEIRVVDSRACASTQGLVVLAAAKAAAKGKNLEEVASIVEQVRQRSGGLMMLDTLRYVYRTGRMSKTASRIASIFNIKPINRLSQDGSIEFVDRTRKRSDGLARLLNLIAKEVGEEGAHFMITHAAAPDLAESFAEQLKESFNCLSLIISDYSPVMGYGAGPGAIFVGWHPELEVLK